MLINHDQENTFRFISYSGKWPTLCSGILELEIEGTVYRFGCKEKHEKFWSSGGFIAENYSISTGEWLIDVGKLPAEIRKYAAEIDHLFNENVPHGCCGGCI